MNKAIICNIKTDCQTLGTFTVSVFAQKSFASTVFLSIDYNYVMKSNTQMFTAFSHPGELCRGNYVGELCPGNYVGGIMSEQIISVKQNDSDEIMKRVSTYVSH